MNKMQEFEFFVNINNPDIIGITKTWCPAGLHDGCLSLTRYHPPF